MLVKDRFRPGQRNKRKREQDRKAKVAEPVAIDHQKLHFYSTLAGQRT